VTPFDDLSSPDDPDEHAPSPRSATAVPAASQIRTFIDTNSFAEVFG
jgi:hypothetical protein